MSFGHNSGKNRMNHIALVTGGTRGIGKAIAEALQEKGYTVIATYHGNDEAAQMFHKKTGIPIYKWDVSQFEACQQGVAEITRDHGPIDILVNNAGITRDSMMHKMSPQQWNEVLMTNLSSCFNVTRCVIEGMRERNFGRIISISSVNGQKGQVGQVNYSAAKAGVIGFTKALALENAAKGITVNAIAPGYTNTEMVQAVPQPVLEKIIAQVPVGRLGLAEEVARTVIFLADDASGYITGTTLSLNGGQYLA
jgi:acetoacetyl-CoA reductase